MPRSEIGREEFDRRLEIAVRRVERQGLRGQSAMAVAIAVLVLEDRPYLLQRVSNLDARCAVRNARRAAARRREAEGEAARLRPEAGASPVYPTCRERQEARHLLASLLKEGAERIPQEALQAFAHRLLTLWRADPDSVLSDNLHRDKAVRAVFEDVVRRRGVEITGWGRGIPFERILLRALTLWEGRAPCPRPHC